MRAVHSCNSWFYFIFSSPSSSNASGFSGTLSRMCDMYMCGGRYTRLKRVALTYGTAASIFALKIYREGAMVSSAGRLLV